MCGCEERDGGVYRYDWVAYESFVPLPLPSSLSLCSGSDEEAWGFLDSAILGGSSRVSPGEVFGELRQGRVCAFFCWTEGTSLPTPPSTPYSRSPVTSPDSDADDNVAG